MPNGNITSDTVPTRTLDQQHRHLREVLTHLRHWSTADSPDEIRQRLRMEELALLRRNGASAQAPKKPS